jgi:hypothetical protein
MVQLNDHLPKVSATGVRWGVFAALVGWSIITWDKPDRIILPAIVGAIILVVSVFLGRQKLKP